MNRETLDELAAVFEEAREEVRHYGRPAIFGATVDERRALARLDKLEARVLAALGQADEGLYEHDPASELVRALLTAWAHTCAGHFANVIELVIAAMRLQRARYRQALEEVRSAGRPLGILRIPPTDDPGGPTHGGV